MKPVALIDFAAAPPSRLAGVALCAAALAALAVCSGGAWQIHQANRTLAAHAGVPVAIRSTPRANAMDGVMVRHVRAVAGELAAPWDDLLAAFEEHSTPEVGLLKLEPDARAAVVRISGQASTLDAMVSYLAALETDPRLARVVLLGHQLEREVPGHPVTFSLSAEWRHPPPQPTRVASQEGAVAPIATVAPDAAQTHTAGIDARRQR